MTVSERALVRLPSSVEQRLYARSGAARWGLSSDTFNARLRVCVASRLQGQSSPSEREASAAAEALHVEDLALAYACAAGDERAWEHFIRETRPPLYAAARQMAPSCAEELADSLFAELFGLEERDGKRRSLLDYYHGHSRLSTWLRTVLAQRHVNRLRIAARTVSLDTGMGPAEQPDPAAPIQPGRAEQVSRAQRALDSALAALESRDRLRLRLYYGEGLKLAEIGRLLGEHEATVSRKLDRAKREIRRLVERTLRDEHGLTAAGVEECLEHAAGAPEIDALKALAEVGAGGRE